ncbi:MAG: serine--tRNA ligase [Alphaproteobacteria bacterium]|nr:MAG: serine--tRNA ligase [Alphaproteobacteria bacterium]
MHDIQFIRDHPDQFDKSLKSRGLAAQAQAILDVDARRRAALTESQQLQAKRNDLSKQIGQLKKQGVNTDMVMKEVADMKDRLAGLEKVAADLDAHMESMLAYIPNLPANDVPVAGDETGNKEARKFGTPTKLPFEAKAHYDLGEKLGMMDFEVAAKITGSRFVMLKGPLARLERAIAQFMIDTHTREFGYTEVSPPYMVNDTSMYGTGNLPKFATDLFYADSLVLDESAPLEDSELERRIFGQMKKDLADRNPELLNYITQAVGAGDHEAFIKLIEAVEAMMRQNRNLNNRKWLIPTAEVPLTNIVADQILSAEQLPLRFTAFTPCFRSEAGSAGKDTRGMLRQHQFSKVELVSVVEPEKSNEEHERMTGAAETILQRLELPYRTMLLCTGDMGFASRKTYDLEVWLPAQNTYREISSCSNCGDFQARRMKARYRGKDDKNTKFVHTLNGSGLAVGRTLIAVMENYQNEDGSITIPSVLQPYMGGLNRIG